MMIVCRKFHRCQSVLQLGGKKVIRRLKFLWLPFVVSGAVLFVYNFYGIWHGFLKLRNLRKPPVFAESAACQIPSLDPYAPEILPFLKAVKPVNCTRGSGPPLIGSNDTALFVMQSALGAYGITNVSDLNCCYVPLYRKVHPLQSSHQYRYESPCRYFENEVSVGGTEFLRVVCFVDGRLIYKDYHAFVPKKRHVEARCRNASSPADQDALSVLILGIDSLSRLNMHRQMPKTIRRLRQLHAIEMLGFNKVGDNTFLNVVPMLSGLTEEELKAKCWPSDDRFFDKCRFAWDDFRDAGYRTAFGEEAPRVGAFTYMKRGFRKQPTDYFTQSFFDVMDEVIGHTRTTNLNLCAGSRMAAEVFLAYVSKFSLKFKSDPTFGLFWENSLSHDLLNVPRLGDDLHVSFLERLEANGALDRLAVLVMSDHGMRWGRIRLTYQGRIEARMPPLFLVLPAWFRDRYAAAVANAGLNARRLTTHFDVHETLLDLMRPTQRLTQEAVRRRSLALTADPTRPPPRAISLFLQISPNRSCAEAGIPSIWCPCITNSSVHLEDAIVLKSAQVLVDHINNLIQPFQQCAQLLLDTVESVEPQDTNVINTDQKIHDYIVVVKTEPGNALFEGSVRHKEVEEDDVFYVTGFVSRLNQYGKQSSCMNNYKMKLYCYCKS